ncbi:sensor histidine kinase [Paenibacillus sp. GCM10027626]|uniref:sensor histidine kinase n=1 Tax=Paenibacillus sp. GCM10027626 TaxID=3273411 RepID=UPI00363BB0C6
MKWRLTGRYLLSVVLIVIIVVVMNMTVAAGLLILQALDKNPLFDREGASSEAITRSFTQYIVPAASGIAITEQGKEVLQHNQAWIQILDESGNQLYSYQAPEEAKAKYTPLDIIHIYKYLEIDTSTVFVGEKELQNHRYSYLIGFKDPNLRRYVVTLDYRTLSQAFKTGSLILIIIDGLIALCIGYLFSKRLTQPLHILIDGIRRLANKNYNFHYKPKGVYKDVFHNVNLLSTELQASELERKKLDQMKEEWIGNISHDIKTPLASIQGYAEMMKDKDYQFTVEEMRDYAEIIERKALYLKDVIEDLNLSTRLKNKELTLNTKNVNLVKLIRNTVIDTLNDSRYANRTIDFQCSSEVIKLNVDEILFRRAISNLIYNAIVHNDEAVAIQVSIELNDKLITIRILDNGKGIHPDELDRLFDRYYRGTNTGELHKGSGLGMAITRDIIHAHGGEIDVDSKLNAGTCIEIRMKIN